ncbi:MAG: hypothetical protein FJZ59_02260 [Chlamydiae bacterium]|jgi:hypothetical protein|nr:hypothetical protein [Chlamydiota bacterium]
MRETNTNLEYIQLINQYGDFNSHKLDHLQEKEASIQDRLALYNYFLERLQKLEEDAKANEQDEVTLDDEFKENIALFLKDHAPQIFGDGLIPEHRNPFDKDLDYSKIGVDEITPIKGRIAYLASQEDHSIAKISREYGKIANDESMLSIMVSHHNVRDPMIRRCIDGQRTGH